MLCGRLLNSKSATAAIILAAGDGSRFDGNTHKLLIEFQGKPLVVWAVEAASAADIEPLIIEIPDSEEADDNRDGRRDDRRNDKRDDKRYDKQKSPAKKFTPEPETNTKFQDIYIVMGATDLSEVLSSGLKKDTLEKTTFIQNDSWQSGQGCSLNIAVSCAKRDGHKSVVVGLADAPLVPSSAWAKVASTEGAIVTAAYDTKEKSGFRSPPVKLEDRVWEWLPLGGDEGARILMKKRPGLVVEAKCEGNPADIDTVADLENLKF